MDGANMNAQVGLTSPAAIGADVCHLNLHKTFAIPHGGGGPGHGADWRRRASRAVSSRATQSCASAGSEAIRAVSAAPWGSASILLISYGYIRMLGAEGMTNATKHAILNANYIKKRLEPHYDVLYTRPNGTVAHEMIFDLRRFKASGVEELDVAKRLMDYGFHAPTVSFPVAGTLMIEPTESESQEELDRFCDAMIAIRQEIQAVVDGKADPKDNVLKNAPHTAAAIAADDWTHPYSREQAAFPLPFVKADKFWPPVGRIDNAHGDRNLICTCPDVAEYAVQDSVSTLANARAECRSDAGRRSPDHRRDRHSVDGADGERRPAGRGGARSRVRRPRRQAAWPCCAGPATTAATASSSRARCISAASTSRCSSSRPWRRIKGDARLNLEILGRLGLTVVEISDEQAWDLHFSEISQCDLIVDAIFGTGLKSPLAGMMETVAADVNASGIPVVAIDLPSGTVGRSRRADRRVHPRRR